MERCKVLMAKAIGGVKWVCLVFLFERGIAFSFCEVLRLTYSMEQERKNGCQASTRLSTRPAKGVRHWC